LKQFEKMHIKRIVHHIFEERELNKDYEEMVLDFVMKAIHSVKPSSQLLGDSMIFSHYIKIKKISHSDMTKSRYVNGVVCTKNVADKRMKNKIEKPRILLLSCALEDTREDENFTNLNKILSQESHFQKRVLKKIMVAQARIDRLHTHAQ